MAHGLVCAGVGFQVAALNINLLSPRVRFLEHVVVGV